MENLDLKNRMSKIGDERKKNRKCLLTHCLGSVTFVRKERFWPSAIKFRFSTLYFTSRASDFHQIYFSQVRKIAMDI
jgi:hypothetical protein